MVYYDASVVANLFSIYFSPGLSRLLSKLYLFWYIIENSFTRSQNLPREISYLFYSFAIECIGLIRKNRG